MLYDPVRKAIPAYFRSGSDPQSLNRVRTQIQGREFSSRQFTDTWYKSNCPQLRHSKTSIFVAPSKTLNRRASRLLRKSSRSLDRRVLLHIYAEEWEASRRRCYRESQWRGGMGCGDKHVIAMNIEYEVAVRAAIEQSIGIEEIMYLDLRKGDVTRYKGARSRML